MAGSINDWLERRRQGRIDMAKRRWVYTRQHDPVVLLINNISPQERMRLYCDITGKNPDTVTAELTSRKEKGGNHFALYWASINRVIAAHYRQLAWQDRTPNN